MLLHGAVGGGGGGRQWRSEGEGRRGEGRAYLGRRGRGLWWRGRRPAGVSRGPGEEGQRGGRGLGEELDGGRQSGGGRLGVELDGGGQRGRSGTTAWARPREESARWVRRFEIWTEAWPPHR